MTPNRHNHIRNRFYIPELVTLEVLHIVVKLKNKKSDIFIMADGGLFGFDDSRIVAKIMDKHLVSEKFPQHMFANGSSGEGQDYNEI